MYVTRSRNGGLSFEAPIPVTGALGNINGAQIVVNRSSGYVYILWTDFTANSIKLARSADNGASWTLITSPNPPTGNMVLPSGNNGLLKGGVRAPSFLMARFNSILTKICLVWHEWQTSGCNSLPAGSCKTDIYYATYSPSGWTTKVRINDNPQIGDVTDQFMPALDFDTSGNLIVTFYDRRNDPSNNLLYQLYSAHIDSVGNRLEPNTIVSSFQTDPRSYYSSNPNFIGDYHDIWSQVFSGVGYYFPAWVGIPAGSGYCSNSPSTPCTSNDNCPSGGSCIINGDIYLSAIQP